MVVSPGPAPGAKSEAFERGKAQFVAGEFREAVASFRAAAEEIGKAGDPKVLAVVHYNLAMTHHAAGQYRLAFEVLEQAQAAAAKAGDRALAAQILALQGSVATFSRRADDAQVALEASLAAAQASGDAKLLATVNLDSAVLLAGQGKTEAALGGFARAEDLARREGLTEVFAKVALNRALMHLNAAAAYLEDEGGISDDWDPRSDEPFQDHLRHALQSLDAAKVRGDQLPEIFSKPILLLGVGDGYRALGRAGTTFVTGHGEKAFKAYRAALDSARATGNAGAKSFALGRMGSLYESAGRLDEALGLTRQARTEAEAARSPDALYQWEWQTGRILAAQGKREEALSAYRRAKHVLSLIRHDVAIGFGNRTLGRSFREAVGALYFEMADLVLQLGDASKSDEELQASYREARLVVEGFKSAELEDFFQDECVNLALAASKGVEAVEASTAVFYVIPLQNRTEILVSVGSTIHRFSSPMARADLNRSADDLRIFLESDGDPSFMEPAQKIYDAIIRPAESLLVGQKIDTLVFVPDGALRTVPMGALHDGERYLIERFAVAVTPGLQLMEPKRIPRENITMLIGAVSEAVQGFAALPAVQTEIDNIAQKIHPTPTIMLNSEFLKAPFRDGLEKGAYQMVQIASHGEFGRSSRDSFVLTFQEKIDLDELEALIRPRKFVGQPVELLGLSACRTAAGDDRAALGLAGVAVKAGARSAFATLWYVDDKVSGALVSDFYRRLIENPEISKAEALRQAQLEVMKDPRNAHPRAWAPYLIIGNWL